MSAKLQPFCLSLNVLTYNKMDSYTHFNENELRHFNILSQVNTTSVKVYLLIFFSSRIQWFNTLRPRQHGRHFPDNIFRCIFLKENIWIVIKISLKFVPKDPIDNIPSLVQIMAWRRPGDKPLSEPMMVRLPMHICVVWPQWVNDWKQWSPRRHKCDRGMIRITK